MLSYEYVKNYIEGQRYALLSDNYVRCKDKLQIQCSSKHIFLMSFDSFRSGCRCPICYKENHKSTVEHDDYEKYRLEVESLSNKNYRKFKHIINPSNLPRGRNKFHLDHKFSVYDGFNHNIPPEIMASIFNLQMLPECDNISKHKKSSISIKMLKEIVNNEVFINK